MDNSPVAVPAFAGEVELKARLFGVCVFITGEGYTLVDQPLDGFAAVLDGEPHCVFMTQAASSVEGVFDVRLHGVGVIEDGGHSALCPERRAVGQIAFAEHCNTHVPRQCKGQAQTGSAAANHQHIMLKMLAHSSWIRKKSAL